MESIPAATPQRIAAMIAALAIAPGLAGCGGHGNGHPTTAPTPKITTLGRTAPRAPADGPLTIGSTAFADGASIPVQYTCEGADIAPPLAWSAPLGAALVVDDPDAVHGLYVHWVVIGIAPGSGSTAEGQTPAGAAVLPNSAGQTGYQGPCPPAGTGTHHYRFTLYQLPGDYQLPGGLAGVAAAQTIAGAATAQAQLTGMFGA
ncbi:YbhB/YbcL family Raf kinase inhibitor-like protein [Mycobacterium sp. 94-17]|uniref:YbhB/YbcL family Raf kinase inhibitor-like protein n=1 Tax=Mycobacterium sp. 94-17 TaxID=2986147 RepID=UPI002D1EB9DA|nr:YbhB/YbcL family Raf kinase inhibitor-like protein [Mycobacterium sp. 94-17]MEB4209904.1 YbhB/YbcL family Raf kinase inhibitor-like protein [Mycobacterium sp. 94-17]